MVQDNGQALFAEACRATAAVERFFGLGPDDFASWLEFGEALAAAGVLERVARDDFPMSRGERMLCLVIVAKCGYGSIAAQAEPDVWSRGGFWSMDRVNGPLALRIIADGVWPLPG